MAESGWRVAFNQRGGLWDEHESRGGGEVAVMKMGQALRWGRGQGRVLGSMH